MRAQSNAPTAANGEGVNEKAAGGQDLASMLPPGWPWNEHVDPLQLKGFARRCWYSGYRSGFNDGELFGRRRGWRERVEQEHRAWTSMARSIKAAGGPFALSYAELERRRRQLPDGYVPRPVPSFDECMASWEAA